jgi:uncharacterized protein
MRALIILSACTESADPEILFKEGKYKKAYRLWQPLANNGDLLAQNYIGIHHYLGLGKERNYKIAKQWFEKAAENGFADAQYNLGVMYENGEFVKQDYVTAYKWLYLANKNGNKHAANRMQGMAEEHKLFPNQMKRAIELAKDYNN